MAPVVLLRCNVCLRFLMETEVLETERGRGEPATPNPNQNNHQRTSFVAAVLFLLCSLSSSLAWSQQRPTGKRHHNLMPSKKGNPKQDIVVLFLLLSLLSSSFFLLSCLLVRWRMMEFRRAADSVRSRTSSARSQYSTWSNRQSLSNFAHQESEPEDRPSAKSSGAAMIITAALALALILFLWFDFDFSSIILLYLGAAVVFLTVYYPRKLLVAASVSMPWHLSLERFFNQTNHN